MATTRPSLASTAVRTFDALLVIHTRPSAYVGFCEPDATVTRWRTLPLDGSMRDSSVSPVAIHKLSRLAVIPPSEFAGAIGSVATTRLVAASMRTSDVPLSFAHSGIHRLEKPNAAPEHGTPPTLMRAVIALVAASMRSISFRLMFAIHSAPAPVAIQSGPPPVTIVVRGRSVTAGNGRLKSCDGEALASKLCTVIQNEPSAV